MASYARTRSGTHGLVNLDENTLILVPLPLLLLLLVLMCVVCQTVTQCYPQSGATNGKNAPEKETF